METTTKNYDFFHLSIKEMFIYTIATASFVKWAKKITIIFFIIFPRLSVEKCQLNKKKYQKVIKLPLKDWPFRGYLILFNKGRIEKEYMIKVFFFTSWSYFTLYYFSISLLVIIIFIELVIHSKK